jgi:hypothetical protein
MIKHVYWSEEAAARLREWADEHTPRFVSFVVGWVEREWPTDEKDVAINDIVAMEYIRNGYAELCPRCHMFKVVPVQSVEDMTVH